jgi:carbonic anhydrase
VDFSASGLNAPSTFEGADHARYRPVSAGQYADALAFLPFHDLDGSVRDDIAAYKASPLVRHDVPVRASFTT